MNTSVGVTRQEVEALPALDLSEELIELDGQAYRHHPYGGGLVAVTAFAAREALICPNAIVKDFAVVVGSVRLFNQARVEEHAVVSDRCTLRDDAVVAGQAILRGSVLMTDQAYVGGSACLNGAVKLQYFARVTDGDLRGNQTIW